MTIFFDSYVIRVTRKMEHVRSRLLADVREEIFQENVNVSKTLIKERRLFTHANFFMRNSVCLRVDYIYD